MSPRSRSAGCGGLGTPSTGRGDVYSGSSTPAFGAIAVASSLLGWWAIRVAQCFASRVGLAVGSPQSCATGLGRAGCTWGSGACAGNEAVRRSVAHAMRTAIEDVPAALQVHVLADVQGGSGVHAFDVTLMNGSALAAVVIPNFLNPKTAEVRRDLEAATWSILDVREADRTSPLHWCAEPSTARRSARISKACRDAWSSRHSTQ